MGKKDSWDPTKPSRCIIDEDTRRCRSYRAGHHMHFIHAKRIGQTPWGWRDGVVVSVSTSGWIEIDYVHEEGHVRALHHEDLTRVLAPGMPVRVHERYYAVGGRFGWVNVFLAEGLGWVPAPTDPGLWAPEMTVGVTDLSTGRAVPMDHPSVIRDLEAGE
jgi:hypothetical protein